MWQQVLNFLNQGWVFANQNLVSGMIIVAIVGAWNLYKKKKRLCYDVFTVKVIHNLKINGLSINYRTGELVRPIENLALTSVFVWNDGRPVIKSEDIYNDENLLKIIVDGDAIDRVRMPYRQGEVVFGEVEILDRKTVINLKVGHLRYGDGFVVQFYHTFHKDHLDKGAIRLEGPIINGNDALIYPVLKDPRKRIIVFLTFLLIFYLAIWLLWVVSHFARDMFLLTYDNFIANYGDDIYNDAYDVDIFISILVNIRNFISLLILGTCFLLPSYWFIQRPEKWFRLGRKISSRFVKVVDWPNFKD